MLSFYAVFTTEFWLIAANACHQKIGLLDILLISNISRTSLCCFGFDLNQSQGTKPISRNGYGLDC